MLSVTADYGEKDKPKALAAVYLLGPKTSEQFVLTSSADKFPALKRSVDSIVESYQAKGEGRSFRGHDEEGEVVEVLVMG